MRAEIIGVGNQNKYQSFFEASREYLQRELAALGITVGSSRLVPGRTPEVFAQLLEASQRGELVAVLTAPEEQRTSGGFRRWRRSARGCGWSPALTPPWCAS